MDGTIKRLQVASVATLMAAVTDPRGHAVNRDILPHIMHLDPDRFIHTCSSSNFLVQ